MKRKLIFSLLVIVGMVFTVLNPGLEVSAATKQKAKPQYGGTYTVNPATTITNLGYPAEQPSSTPAMYQKPALESLARFNSKGGLTPMLAESWKTDVAGKTITYVLKKGIKFHDGTDFNAEAVKWNIEQYIAAKRSETASIESIGVINNYTVRLNLKNWDSSALDSISFYVLMVSPTAFQKNGKEWAIANPVGTGAFKLNKWDRGVTIEYVKNPDYWQKGLPYLDRIVMVNIQDQATNRAALEKKEIDGTRIEDFVIANELKKSGKYTIVLHTTGIGVIGQGLVAQSNDPKSPFHDVRVRQAMSYAIDTQTINKTLNYGFAVANNQWGVPGFYSYSPKVSGYPYNPKKAKQLLAQAGYPNGFKTKFFANAKFVNLNTAIQSYLAQVGIQVELIPCEDTKVQQLYYSTWEGGLIYHWYTAQGDLPLYMARHLDPNGSFYAKGIIHPTEVTKQLQEAREAPDLATKKKVSWELQKLVYDKYCIFTPLFVPTAVWAKQPRIQDDGFYRTHVSDWTPERTWIKK
jgi:peptide/nickel transport system substrate-binding protein